MRPQLKGADLTSTTPADPPALLRADEVAKMLNVSADWVYEHSSQKQPKRPRIPCIRLGDRLPRFRREDIEAFIQEHLS